MCGIDQSKCHEFNSSEPRFTYPSPFFLDLEVRHVCSDTGLTFAICIYVNSNALWYKPASRGGEITCPVARDELKSTRVSAGCLSTSYKVAQRANQIFGLSPPLAREGRIVPCSLLTSHKDPSFYYSIYHKECPKTGKNTVAHFQMKFLMFNLMDSQENLGESVDTFKELNKEFDWKTLL